MPKKVIISGGARGIGRALALRFLEKECHVFILDIDEEELRHTTKTYLKRYYETKAVESAVCNLRDVEDIRQKIEEAAKFLGGRIDVLINNGGIANPKWKDGKTMCDKDTFQEWQAYIETNLTAPFAASQACLPYMKDEDAQGKVGETSDSTAGPCIIHIGSFRAYTSDAHQEGYASSKSGLLGLMHSMAISLKPFGIRVNLIAPGRIKVAHESKEGDEKGMTWAEQNEEKDVHDHATNRAGRPGDICDAAEFLVNSGFITGQDITVDGGATKKKS